MNDRAVRGRPIPSFIVLVLKGLRQSVPGPRAPYCSLGPGVGLRVVILEVAVAVFNGRLQLVRLGDQIGERQSGGVYWTNSMPLGRARGDHERHAVADLDVRVGGEWKYPPASRRCTESPRRQGSSRAPVANSIATRPYPAVVDPAAS